MWSERERRQPRLAVSKTGSCKMSLLRCMATSARSSSGKSCSSWGERDQGAGVRVVGSSLPRSLTAPGDGSPSGEEHLATQLPWLPRQSPAVPAGKCRTALAVVTGCLCSACPNRSLCWQECAPDLARSSVPSSNRAWTCAHLHRRTLAHTYTHTPHLLSHSWPCQPRRPHAGCRTRGSQVGWPSPADTSYLVSIDAVVHRPGGLEVLQQPLLELLGQAVDADEVLEVLHASVVERAAGVHALDDGRDVAEDDGVHQCWGPGGQRQARREAGWVGAAAHGGPGRVWALPPPTTQGRGVQHGGLLP